MAISRSEALAGIARRHLDIPTLQTRRSDALDFHEVGVVSLTRAMREAYALKGPPAPPPARKLEALARDFDIPTLQVRNRDELDFHDLAVWTIADLLASAAAKGEEAARRTR